MKFNSLFLAVTVLTPVVANAGVTITPFVGYHSYANSEGNQRSAIAPWSSDKSKTTGAGVALYSDITTGGAVGVELTPNLALEADYLNTQTKASNTSSNRYDALHNIVSGNLLIGTDAFSTDKLKPYLLVGAGRSSIYAKPIASVGKTVNRNNGLKSNDTVGNLGVGAHYRLNDMFALRGEARAIRNFDNDWWETVALAGLQVTFGGHLTNYVPAPVIPVVPVEPQPIVVAPRVDSDHDGVYDDMDKCPNTPTNYVVGEDGCAKQLSQTVNLTVKVLFDTNKSIIKPQYKAEVSKVADMMKEYSDSVALIEGHTDSKGSAKLNTRLSDARAAAVKNMLISDFGIDASRLTSQGFGGSRPVASNATAAGRAQNRRVVADISANKTTVETK